MKDSFLGLVREELTKIYLLIMLVLYPLFLVHGYEDLVYKKWALLLYAAGIFVVGSFFLSVLIQIGNRKNRIKTSWSVIDGMVLLYFLCVIISFLGAVDRQNALWGVFTWYMGAIAQMLFIGSYFFISRGYVKMRYLQYLCAGVYFAVCAILLLQRFGIDVFSLYAGYPVEVKLNFVTTMGQVTWTSSYISVLLAAGMGFFYQSEKRLEKIIWGIGVGTGAAAEAVLNCDSGVICIAGVLLVLLWISLGGQEQLKHFLEILMIVLGAVGIVGIGERLFTERFIFIDAVYMKAAQSIWIWVIFILTLVVYLLLQRNIIRLSGSERQKKLARRIYSGILLLGALGIVLLFILHGKGYFSGSASENYFRFTVWWGNSRGFIWRVGAAVFADFNLWRKLFGCGPDCFTPYAYGLMGDAINEFWHNQVVPNVHNEWFNAVINYGLIGGGAYLGIFTAAAKGFIEKGKQEPIIFGIGLAAVGYIIHNVLCYQQIIGTPIIFILLGVGEALRREKLSN